MGKDTAIEWCDDTINPVMGCDGCELSSRGAADAVEDGQRDGHCYAEQLHKLRAGRPGYAPDFFAPTMFTGRMAAAARWSDLRGTKREGKPWLDGMPRVIFINDMGDALSRSIPFEFLRDEVTTNVSSETGRRHLYLWLTKRPRRMAEFSRWLKAQGIAWPANLWPGTSVTSQKVAGRVTDLLAVEGAPGRFLSCEPMLGPVDLGEWIKRYEHCGRCGAFYPVEDAVRAADGRAEDRCAECAAEGFMSSTWGELQRQQHEDGDEHEDGPGISWVIIGGESGSGARPFDLAWARSLVEQCKAAAVAVFVKQLGSNPIMEPGPLTWPTTAPKGGDWAEWPDDLRVREMPRVETP